MAHHTVDPAFVHGSDRSDVDRLAATVVTDVQDYWAKQYPEVFDAPWHNLDGGFFSVDTNGEGTAPPCSADVSDLVGNAYYCATVDAIAWDRTALLPVLQEHYGDASVVVVLAHELGHAVQQRAGIGSDDEPARLEAMADCFAGAYVRSVTEQESERLSINAEQLDRALRAITLFRDPVSTNSTEAHGSAFERVTAFQDGYSHGPRRCTDITETHLAALPPDGPNLPLNDALRTESITTYFADLAGPGWAPPAIRSERSCPEAIGAAGYCPHPPAIVLNDRAITDVHAKIGDQAVTTLLAAKFALTANAELGNPTTGAAASRQVACLTGAYTAAQPELTQGDLDEAVTVLLDSDNIARDARGANPLTGYDRLAAFRTGALGGAAACT
ncbi:peptidase [Saccharopolyspora sp. NPDC000359]|uniref:peptidase n=1 Tax=Saccharopolyspora sp. NPDC000359 TaxID=3154251 RepID=UPI003321A834